MLEVFQDLTVAWQTDVVDGLLRKSGSSGIAFAAFRDIDVCPSVEFVGYRGISAEALKAYKTHRIFMQDPFLTHAIRQNYTPGRCAMLYRDGIDLEKSTNDDYRYFSRFFDINIDCAAVFPLRDDLFLCACLHSSGSSPAITRSGPDIEADIHHLINQVGLFLLTQDFSTARETVNGDRHPGHPKAADQDVAMSHREKVIVDLVCNGMMNKQIAYQLGVSVNSVENGLRRVFKKYNVINRASLIHKYHGRSH